MAANRQRVSASLAKVLVVGDVATGKTSLIRRYVRNDFSEEYKTTIGVDFSLKALTTDGVKINVQLWDIAGQERFSGLSRLFYTHAVGAIIVFDLFDRNTLESTLRWKMDIDSKVFLPDGSKIPVILLANKSDLIGVDDDIQEQACMIAEEEIKDVCEQNGFMDYYLVSAKSGDKVEQACFTLVERIVQNNNRMLAANPAAQQSATATAAAAGGGGGVGGGKNTVKLGGSDSTTTAGQKSGGCC